MFGMSPKDCCETWGMRSYENTNPDNQIDAQENYMRRCADMTREFGLTRREEEVLALLGCSMSVPNIERALVISKSTAKTHVHRIYAKTSVHNREELFDLIGRKYIPNEASADISLSDTYE